MFKWFGKKIEKEKDESVNTSSYTPIFTPTLPLLVNIANTSEPNNVIHKLTSIVYKDNWFNIKNNISSINYCSNRFSVSDEHGSSIILETQHHGTYRLLPDASRYIGFYSFIDGSTMNSNLEEYNDILSIIEDMISVPIEEFTHGMFKYWTWDEIMSKFTIPVIATSHYFSPTLKFI